MFKFNVLPGLHFTNPYGTEGNPANAPNAVTLTRGQFTSNAAITVEGYNFKELNLDSGSLTISITQGTIKNASGDLQTESPALKENDVLKLEANGKITKPVSATGNEVKLEGIIVVTSTGKEIGTALTISGGPGGTVSGTLNLGDVTDADGKHVTITGGTSKITINKTAYEALTPEYKTETSLKIGASKSDPRNPSSAAGGAEALGHNSEDSFTKYWHLLPPNNI